jgi:hypothetical protein
MSPEYLDYHRARASRTDHTMLEIAWRPGVDFASGLTAYYVKLETHHRKLAHTAYREWEECFSLAERYRLLAAEAAAVEKLAA